MRTFSIIALLLIATTANAQGRWLDRFRNPMAEPPKELTDDATPGLQNSNCYLRSLSQSERDRWIYNVERLMYDPSVPTMRRDSARDEYRGLVKYCGPQPRQFTVEDQRLAESRWQASGIPQQREQMQRDSDAMDRHVNQQTERVAREGKSQMLRMIGSMLGQKDECRRSDREEIERLREIAKSGYRDGYTIDEMDAAGRKAGMLQRLCGAR